MKLFWSKRHQSAAASIESVVEEASTGKISRRQMMASLTALGVSATAIATFVAVADEMKKRQPATKTHSTGTPSTTQEQQNLQAHQDHISLRASSPNPMPSPTPMPPTNDIHVEQHVAVMLQDYHPDAIVEDPITGVIIQGHEAIAHRKRSELFSMKGLHIQVSKSYAVGDQVVAEWVATGVHAGNFLGFAASNRSFSIQGATVVTWKDGKITRESLYYDVAEARRQLGLTVE